MSNPIITETENQVYLKKVLSAIFFGVSSLMFTVVNETVVTAYYFQSFHVLVLVQMALTIVVLWIGRNLHLMKFPSLDTDVTRRIWPLPLLFLGNMSSGQSITQELNLDMLTAMRRLALLMTMVFEKHLLGIKASCFVQTSVMAIIGGALLAASNDLTLSWNSCILVLLNDAFLAGNVVYMKMLLDTKDGLGIYGLMFYDSYFMFIPVLFVTWVSGQLYETVNYVLWKDPLFMGNFILACVLGVVLSYSTMLCTYYNGALTANVIGSFMNIILIYLGMVITEEYFYNWLNIIGLNICVIASLAYTYVTFKPTPVISYFLVKNDKEEIL